MAGNTADESHEKHSRKDQAHNSREKVQTPPDSYRKYQSTILEYQYKPALPLSIDNYFKVLAPRGHMAEKHAASAPYYLFYSTVVNSKETYTQPYSITFQEILDPSLGSLQCSLQINFIVDINWLLAQYEYAGCSHKNLTIVFGEYCSDIARINRRHPNINSYYVTNTMIPNTKHNSKIMILCYEDGSVRVVVSTANLFLADWENRTNGLWISPRCPELPENRAIAFEGESPTMFKRSLIRYLNQYHLHHVSYYVERVKRCDFSHINVFLVASVPGAHFDVDWGFSRMGYLLSRHCSIPLIENEFWPLLAQTCTLDNYADQNFWLTGDFFYNFTQIRNLRLMPLSAPAMKIIYPSVDNIKDSYKGLIGGLNLPYKAQIEQLWLNNLLYQWSAESSGRARTVPGMTSYTRISPDNKMAAFYLLTSSNLTKDSWGVSGDHEVSRIVNYEAGVLFLPRFVINEDFFPLEKDAKDRLIIPYDIPPVRYTEKMKPWELEYIH